MKIELTKYSGKFYHPFSHVFIFVNMLPESYGFVAMPVIQAVSKIHVPIYSYLISEGRNCST